MSSLNNWMSEEQQKAELLACVSQLFVSDSFKGLRDVDRFGIGLYLGVMKDSGLIFAKNVVADSPASKANIEVGDVLLEINRQKVQPKKLIRAQVHLFGHDEYAVSLKLKRKDGTFYFADKVPVSKDRQLAGIGLFLKQKDGRQVDCPFVVDRLAQGSAAMSSASIKKDDELLEIDGQSVSGEFITDVHKMLAGEVGSVVTLTLARRDDKEKYKAVLLRARISTHASDALKDISTFLRLDNKDTFFARRLLMEWKLFQLSLVDILADPMCEFTLFKNALKVSVGLLLPIELIDKDADPSSLNKADLSSRSLYINQVNERIREMKNFLSQPRNHRAVIVIMRYVSEILALEGTDRSSDQTVFLELILYFFVNIIRPANVLERRDSPVWMSEKRDDIIVMLHKENVIDAMIWLASEIERPENRDLAGILVKFFSFLLGVEDAELLLSLKAKSEEDAEAKKSSVRFIQAQVPVMDSFALLLREQEQKRLEMASRTKSMRNQRISGTYKTFVSGHAANGTAVIMQKSLREFAVPTLEVPSKFGRAKLPVSDPSTRADVQGGGRSRISPAVICLVECSESFVKSCFNSLLFAALYDIQQERENLSEGDEQAFLQLLSFGLRFNRRNKMDYQYVGALVHVKMFQVVSAITTKYVLSSNFTALPAAVNTFRELIMVLRDLLSKARKEKDQRDLQADPSAPLPPSPAVDILRSLVEEFAVFDTLVKLIQEYESHRNSKKYLSDLIDCVHQAMRMLQEHAAWVGALRAKKIKGKKKKAKKDDIKSIRRKVQSVDADGVFKTLKPHHLNPNDVVGFDGKLPSGAEPKKLYFVLMVENDPANSFRVSATPGGEPLLFEPTATAVFAVVRNPDNTKGTKDARALAAIEKEIQAAIDGGLVDKLLEGGDELVTDASLADAAPKQPADGSNSGENVDEDEDEAIRKRSGDRSNRRVVASDDEDEEGLPKSTGEGNADGNNPEDSGDETDNSLLKLDEDDEKEDDIERVSFSFAEYAHRFCQSSTISKLVPLLKSYQSNSDRLNHQIWYILNLAVEHCDMMPMLFQLSLFDAMLPILDEPSNECRCKELNKLCKVVVRSFFAKAVENPASYVELLFWTKFKSDMEVFEDKKPSEPAQDDDGMDEEMRQLALEMLERQKEARASKPKRSVQDVIAAVDGSETNPAHSDDEPEEQEATYQRGVQRSVSTSAAGLKPKKVASKSWKDGEDQIIRDMVANPPRGKDLLVELESALKIRSVGQIRHRMKILGIEAPKRSRLHRSKSSSSHKNASSSMPWNEAMDAVIREQFIPAEDQESQLGRLVDALLNVSSLPERARIILGSNPSKAALKVSRRIRHLGLSKQSQRKSTRRLEQASAGDSDQSANSDVSSSSSSGSESETERHKSKRRPAKARAVSKSSTAAQEQLCNHLISTVAASGNESLVAGLVWLRTRFEAAIRQEEGRSMTIVALKPEHFDILENECVSEWLKFSGATAPGHGMANWRLKTGSSVQAALQNLGAILSDPSSFTLSPEQLLALTSSEVQPKQRDEFDFSDDDAALASTPRVKEKRKKRNSNSGRVAEGRSRGTESRRRNEVSNREENLQASAANSDDEPVVAQPEEHAVASPEASNSPSREPVRRKRVVTAAGSDSDGELHVGTKERTEPTPVTEVRKRRMVVLSDDDE